MTMYQKNPSVAYAGQPNPSIAYGGRQKPPMGYGGQNYPPPAAESSFYDGRDTSASRPFMRPVKVPELYRPPYFVANGASFIMMLVGTIFFLIAFGAPAWYVVPPEDTDVPKTFGLWRLCVRTECVVEMTNDYMVKEYLKMENENKVIFNNDLIQAYEKHLVPVKALMSIAVIFVFITVSANIAFILGWPTFFIETGAQLLTGVLVGLSVGLFGGNFRDRRHEAPFGWAYWCGVVSAIVLICNGISMAFISYCVYKKYGLVNRRKR